MAFWKFWRRRPPLVPESPSMDRGFLVFENTSEVIRAENILKNQEWQVSVMGPPPELRQGCDLVIEFPLLAELEIVRTLREAGLPPLQAVPVSGPLLTPVDLFQIKDFGDYLMVRAANMKVTVAKDTGTIVNISGGGCPDVPYLAHALVGKSLAQAPRPRDLGHTLCGYALQLAVEEMERQCSP